MQVVVDDLPEILFLGLHSDSISNIDSTPEKCRVLYYSTKHKPLAVTYGWLGSLCYVEPEHWAVHWRHKDPDVILQYDHRFDLSIRENGIDRNAEDEVPPKWWQRGELVILQQCYSNGPLHSQRLANHLGQEISTRPSRELDPPPQSEVLGVK